MNPLNNPRVSVLKISEYFYDVFIDDEMTFLVERQAKSPFHWLLYDENGTILDQDQYRTDLFERIAVKYPVKDIKS